MNQPGETGFMISVVMGVYNNADTLPAALDSILSQECAAMEFIVIDDGSADGSAAILDEAAKNDPRLKVVHKKNEGLTRALIDGCAMASAPWIARQDADDVSLPGRLAALLALAQNNPNAVLFASSAWYVGPQDERLYKAICTPDPGLARQQVLDLGIGPPAHGCVMFSRVAYQRVGGYRACFYYGQDSDLWMRLAEHGGVAYTNEIFYCYRLSPGAISGSYGKWQKAFGRLGQRCRYARRSGLSEARILGEAQALSDRLRAAPRRPSALSLALSHYHIGCLLEKTDPAAAARYFRQAIACQPLALRAWARLILVRARGRG
jgi:glycosyltransferase involved in cell wall biosynthesis